MGDDVRAAEAAIAVLRAGRNDDGVVDGFVRDEAATGLSAIALEAGPARDRALGRLEELEGARAEFNDAISLDVDLAGWPWTRDTFGWVEPTSRALRAPPPAAVLAPYHRGRRPPA